jgi:DNA-binding transcriptional LysR family regulator
MAGGVSLARISTDRTTREAGLKTLLQRRLKMRHLLLLTTVSECLSLSKAAAMMNMTQSAVTKSLRELEESLDVKLFSRSPRGVVPTKFGRSLIHHARAILSEVHSAADEINDLKIGTSGQVVIGILRLAAQVSFSDALTQLRKTYPRLSIVVVEGNFDPLRLGLRTGEIDLLFGYLSDSRPLRGLAQEHFYRDGMAFVARPGHPMRGCRGAVPADLIGQQWILPPRDSLVRRHVDTAFRTAGCDSPSCATETESVLLIQSLLSRSDMIAVLPRQVGRELAALGLAAILPIEIGGASLPVGVLMPSDRPLAPAATALVELLRQNPSPVAELGKPDRLRQVRSVRRANVGRG